MKLKSNAVRMSFDNGSFIELSIGPLGLVVHFSPDAPHGTLLFEDVNTSDFFPGKNEKRSFEVDTKQALSEIIASKLALKV